MAAGVRAPEPTPSCAPSSPRRPTGPERLNIIGEDFAGPTIIDFGIAAQKQRFRSSRRSTARRPGEGLARALAADIRLASPAARLNAAFVRIGLVNRVVPAGDLMAEALAMAALIVANSPAGV